MARDLASELLDTWQTHNRISLYLLDAISPEGLAGKQAGGKGRSVGEIFAHMHNVRLMWIKSAAPELLENLEKVEKESAENTQSLRNALERSGAAIATLLEQSVASGRVKGFKPHPLAFLGYLISHESHHRGEIELTLTQAGFKLDQKVSYGLWEWGVR
jgi:uncharacterized damage-inducible protein DinB